MTLDLHSSLTSSPGANTAATVTLAAPGAGKSRVLWFIAYSYSGNPTGGNLQIADGTQTVFEVDITAGGPATVEFNQGAKADPNTAVTVTLAAGGTGILGKLVVLPSVV